MREVLDALWPGRFDGQEIQQDASLGKDGLRLDSIEIAELVLECEARAGRPAYGADELLGDGPVTVGRLVDHLSAG